MKKYTLKEKVAMGASLIIIAVSVIMVVAVYLSIQEIGAV